MSMYMGRFGNGKPVFSILNRPATAWGENSGDHYDPSWESLFHSDMPHVMVKKRHMVYFGNAGWGYFTGWMSDDLRWLLYSTNRVMIPILVYRDNATGKECYKQMTGVNKSSTYKWQLPDISFNGFLSGNVSFDLQLEWGYYTQMDNTNIIDCLARAWTTGGCSFLYGSHGDDYDPGTAVSYGLGSSPAYKPWEGRPSIRRGEARCWTPRSNPPYGDVIWEEQMNLVDPHYMAPLGYKGATGMNAIYVRAGGSRNANWNTDHPFNIFDRNNSQHRMDMAYPKGDILGADNGYGRYFKSSLEKLRDIGAAWSISEVTFNITPIRMEFLELSMDFDRWGGYSALPLGQGNEILISKEAFVIRGWDYRNTEAELMYVSTGWGSPNPFNTGYFHTSIQHDPSTWDGDGGAFRLFGTTATGEAVGTDTSSAVESNLGNSYGYQVGMYRFPQWSTVEINSTNNSISLNGAAIWAPWNRPLLLFPQNKVSNVIIGNNEWLQSIGYGSIIKLQDIWIGDASATGGGAITVLLAMEWISNSLCDQDGDPGFDPLISPFSGTFNNQPHDYFLGGAPRRLTQMDYSLGDGISHQIMVLATDQYIPFFNTNVISYSKGANGYGKNRFQFYLKRVSSGAIEVWARSNAIKPTVPKWQDQYPDPYVQWPSFRLAVQRLA